MNAKILQLDVTGTPAAWLTLHQAATLYVRNRVRWEAGAESFTLRGGRARNGEPSELVINAIVGTGERYNKLRAKPGPTSGREIFLRDRICMYCGIPLTMRTATVDHVFPAARGGQWIFENLALSCVRCNAYKSCRSPEEAGLKLLAVPYRPDPAALMLLLASGRRITACQQAMLETMASKAPANRRGWS